MITIYITKYLGIITEAEVEFLSDYLKPVGYYSYFTDKEFFTDKEDAIKDCQKRIDKKIQQTEKYLEKLKNQKVKIKPLNK